MWAKLISLVISLVKPLAALFIYLAGKRAAINEIKAAQNEKDAELANEYATIASEPRDPVDEPDKLRDKGNPW